MFVQLKEIVGDPPKLIEKNINKSFIASVENMGELPGTYCGLVGKPACKIKLLDGSELEVLGKVEIINGDITFF